MLDSHVIELEQFFETCSHAHLHILCTYRHDSEHIESVQAKKRF